jgi:hypothetical protein
MTGFCKHGSSGHLGAGSGDVMDDEVGGSGRARAPRTLNLTAGPFTSGSTDLGCLEAFAALSKGEDTSAGRVSPTMHWCARRQRLLHNSRGFPMLRYARAAEFRCSPIAPPTFAPPSTGNPRSRHPSVMRPSIRVVADRRPQAVVENMHSRRRQLICTSIRAQLR